jgi:hypothetical protein
METHRISLRDLYRTIEKPGKNSVRDLQDALDKTVLAAYGFDEKSDLLGQLLALNLEVSAREQHGEPVQSPGLPEWYPEKEKLVSEDCVHFLR